MMHNHNKMDMLHMQRLPFLSFFGSAASDDDFADRLNYKYTVAILVVFAFVVTNKHFSHNQINCWVPALFSKNFEEYTNLVCWITNTYYIPFDKQIPNSEPDKKSTELRYYQWVAYILLFLSLLFYLPRVIWRTFSLRSGIDIKDVIEASHDFKSVGKLEKNRRMIEYMIGTIDQYVDDPRRQHANRNFNFFRRTVALLCICFGKFLGNYLVILYLFVKLLYIVNCLGQLFLISVLLGRNYYIYGASIFHDFIQGKGYADSEYFPRVTMCKFQVRELGLKNFSHEYNVQCVLPINLFNQQIFTFLWFWYFMLLLINTISLFIWIYRFIPRNQYNYAIRRIKLLRVRLIETSKIPQNNEEDKKFYSRDFKLQTSVCINKKTAISRILSQNDYHYSIDELSMDSNTNKPKNLARRSKMFPNIPSDFEFNASLKYRKKGERTIDSSTTTDWGGGGGGGTTTPSTYEPVFKQMRVPIKNQYDSYMSPKSFCIKNYEAFVYEYLEADGMFMLRMIHSNSGDFVCTQVLHNLWKLFLYKKFILKNEKKNLEKNSSEQAIYSSNDDDETDNSRIHHTKLKANHKKKSPFLNKLFKQKTSATIAKPATSISKRLEKNRSLKTNNNNKETSVAEDLRRMQSIKRVLNRPKVKIKTIPP